MVSVVPPTLHGGNTAATREPSGRRESRIGFSSETSSPSARAMFFTATLRLRSSISTPSTASISPLRSTKIRREPLTMISVTSGSWIKCAIGRRNGRITSKLMSEVSRGDVIEVAPLDVEIVRLEIAVRRRLGVEAVVRQDARLGVLPLRGGLWAGRGGGV